MHRFSTLAAVVLIAGGAQAAETDRTVKGSFPGRAAITATIADLRHIATPEGIEVLEQVDVGGDKQWISIRGRNRANPVLLMIHGGPGTPMMPYSWAYQSPWEDYFTVVNWDQRGVGKNAAAANRAALLPTLTLDRIADDGIAVIEHIRRQLGKSKVVVLGFSWGSSVGTTIARKRPDLVSAYVGVGQSVGPSDEAILYSETIKAAGRNGDTAAVASLTAMGPYPRADGSTPLDLARKIRSYAVQYDGLWYGQHDTHLLKDLAPFAPEYSDGDVEELWKGSGWLSDGPLMNDLVTFNLETAGEFKVPIVLLLGRYDLFTPYEAGRRWIETVHAPHKKLVTFERSSHFVMVEEPGRFLSALIDEVLPLTEGSSGYAVSPRVARIAKPQP